MLATPLHWGRTGIPVHLLVLSELLPGQHKATNASVAHGSAVRGMVGAQTS